MGTSEYYEFMANVAKEAARSKTEQQPKYALPLLVRMMPSPHGLFGRVLAMRWPRLTVPCIWNQSSDCQVVARHQNLEVVMTLAKISLASAAAITMISFGAFAQENQNKGRIT